MATDRPRYTVSVDNELFQQIEDFRFERRFQTRSEATVELIRRTSGGGGNQRKKTAAGLAAVLVILGDGYGKGTQ